MKKSFLKSALVMTLAMGVMGATTMAKAQAGLMDRDRSEVKKVDVKEEKQADNKMDKKAAKEEMPVEGKMDKKDAKDGKCCMMKGQKECACPKCGVKMDMVWKCPKCGHEFKMSKKDQNGDIKSIEKKCSKCGARMEAACKCPKCGKTMMMGDMKKCPMKAEKMEKGDKKEKVEKKMKEEKKDEAKN